MKIAVNVIDTRAELDLSYFIPALSEEEVMSVLEDTVPLLIALLEAQLAWTSTTDLKRLQLVQVHLSLGMMTQAAISSAVYRARVQKDVVQERASIDDLGFPEFGRGPALDD